MEVRPTPISQGLAYFQKLVIEFEIRRTSDLISLQSWCVNDLIPIRLLEARLQAIDDLGFEAPPGNGRFLS